ncbi:MAG: hypothetical protein RXQ96_07610 [Thermocladium sp.]|jgi:hypothetical protein|nr:MAG: hypothetical protein AT710_00590 [Thermocladium sp. ECH_B]
MQLIIFASSAVWNGVHFNLNSVIPWYVILIYGLIYVGVLAWIWRSGKFSSFKTIDFVYIALIVALLIVYNFFISPIIPKVGAITTWFYYPMIGEIFLLLTVAALVGKPGTMAITMFVYTLLSDIFHYGFGGEPFYFIYEILAYGAILDMWLAYRGELFLSPYIKSRPGSTSAGASLEERIKAQASKATTVGYVLMVLDALIGAIPMAVAYSLFYRGFFATFVSGFVYKPSLVYATTIASVGGGIVMGLISLPFVAYIKRVVKGAI